MVKDELHYTNGHDGKHYDQSKVDEYLKKCSHMSKMNNKKCIKCGDSLPATTENFYRDKYRKDGLFTICKKCKKKEYQEKKTKTNRNKIKEKESDNNLSDEDNIYEWVKSLSKEKRELLDPMKISVKIKEELFRKEEK